MRALLLVMLYAFTSCSAQEFDFCCDQPDFSGTTPWDYTDCFGKSVDVEGPIETYTQGLWTMAVTGNISTLQDEIGGELWSHRIPSGLGDDTENAGYASTHSYYLLMATLPYELAMYHPTAAAPDHFIVYQPDTEKWWRYDVGNNEKRCGVLLVSKSQ